MEAGHETEAILQIPEGRPQVECSVRLALLGLTPLLMGLVWSLARRMAPTSVNGPK